MDDEKAWVRQALAGDQASLERLINAYKLPVFNLAYRLLNDPAEAEDAAQETFVRVYTRLGTYQEDKKFSSWILSITSHYCIDRLRRRRGNWLSIDDLTPRQALSDPHEGPEKAALRQEEQDALSNLLRELPEPYRVVLVLRYWQDQSYDEMARLLNTTESAIKSRLHRARCILAERIRAQETHTGLPSASPMATPSAPAVLKPKMEAVQHALRTSDRVDVLGARRAPGRGG